MTRIGPPQEFNIISRSGRQRSDIGVVGYIKAHNDDYGF